MNNHAQANLSTVIVVVGIIAIFIILILFASSNVGYSVNINDSEFRRGTDIILSYEIENGLLFEEIKNVKFVYSIHDKYNHIRLNDTVDIGQMSSRSTVSDKIIIETNSLFTGEYTIWTNIEYWKSGKLEKKYLSLDFTIVN